MCNGEANLLDEEELTEDECPRVSVGIELRLLSVIVGAGGALSSTELARNPARHRLGDGNEDDRDVEGDEFEGDMKSREMRLKAVKALCPEASTGSEYPKRSTGGS